jgi:hypothetical protein
MFSCEFFFSPPFSVQCGAEIIKGTVMENTFYTLKHFRMFDAGDLNSAKPSSLNDRLLALRHDAAQLPNYVSSIHATGLMIKPLVLAPDIDILLLFDCRCGVWNNIQAVLPIAGRTRILLHFIKLNDHYACSLLPRVSEPLSGH